MLLFRYYALSYLKNLEVEITREEASASQVTVRHCIRGGELRSLTGKTLLKVTKVCCHYE